MTGARTRSELLVIVPALNESDSVAAVVRDAMATLGADVVVIDDGSTDDTAVVARGAGAAVLIHPFNLGVGGAIRTGLRYAAQHGYRSVLQLDGDGQHPPEEGKKLLARLESDGLDLVIGSRFASGYEVSRARRAVMKLLSRVVTRRLGTRITDTTSGFRAMGPRTIDAFARDYPLDYLSDTVEALLLAASLRLRVAEVDVTMRERQGGVQSSGRFKSTYHLVRLVLVVVVHAIRPGPGPEPEVLS